MAAQDSDPGGERLAGIGGEPEYVVLLHGIARSNRSMAPLADYLKKHGYAAVNIDYPSTRYCMDELVERLHQMMQALNLEKDRTIHFVGYSMGALIVRGLVQKHRPPHLGRVVMLAPPNGGSEVADFLKNNFLFKWIYGPAGQELGTNRDGCRDRFGDIDFELGVVAGDRSLDPFSSAIIAGPSDGKVSIERTQVPGMKDHIVVHATHTFIMRNEKAMTQTLHFLRHGVFYRGGQP